MNREIQFGVYADHVAIQELVILDQAIDREVHKLRLDGFRDDAEDLNKHKLLLATFLHGSGEMMQQAPNGNDMVKNFIILKINRYMAIGKALYSATEKDWLKEHAGNIVAILRSMQPDSYAQESLEVNEANAQLFFLSTLLEMYDSQLRVIYDKVNHEMNLRHGNVSHETASKDL